MIHSLLHKYDERRHEFEAQEIAAIHVWKLDVFVKHIRKLEAENAELRALVYDNQITRTNEEPPSLV